MKCQRKLVCLWRCAMYTSTLFALTIVLPILVPVWLQRDGLGLLIPIYILMLVFVYILLLLMRGIGGNLQAMRANIDNMHAELEDMQLGVRRASGDVNNLIQRMLQHERQDHGRH